MNTPRNVAKVAGDPANTSSSTPNTPGPELDPAKTSRDARLRSTLAARIDLQLLELSAITARVRRFRHELDAQNELAAFAVLHDATSHLMNAARQLGHARALVEIPR